MKRFALLLLVILVLSCCVLSLCACTAQSQHCYDTAQLFDQTQRDAIEAKAASASRFYGVPVYVTTCGRNGSHAAQSGDEFVAANGLTGSFVVITVSAQAYNHDYHFDIDVYGKAQTKVTDEELYDIAYSAAGDLVLGNSAQNACDGVQQMIKLCGKAYRPWEAIIVVALLLGSGAALAAALIVRRQYSRKRANNTYPLDKYCRLNLKDRTDTYSHSVTTFVVINNNSSGGGFGGGHSSGGGGSHHIGR